MREIRSGADAMHIETTHPMPARNSNPRKFSMPTLKMFSQIPAPDTAPFYPSSCGSGSSTSPTTRHGAVCQDGGYRR